MSDLSQLVQMVVSGVVTGGAGAATTVLAFFREIRGRIEKLEKMVGSAGSAVDPKTGLFLITDQLSTQVRGLEESLKKFRRDVDAWEDDPPEWLARVLTRRTGLSSFSLDEIEQHFEARLKAATDKLKRLEEAISDTQDQVSRLQTEMSHDMETLVQSKDYEEDSRRRADEIRRIQENLHTANGFLRGVMAALGYTEPPSAMPSEEPPMLPRRK